MEPLSDQLASLETQHRQLIELCEKSPVCIIGTPHETSSAPTSCAGATACAIAVRQSLHQLMFAVVAHFEAEHRLMRSHAMGDHYLRHAQAHGDLMTQLNAIVADFVASNDCCAAIPAIAGFIATMDDHMATVDQEMFRLI